MNKTNLTKANAMQPTFEIPQGLLENKDFFKDEFYQRFKLRTADAPLKLTDNISKDYLFPTFYGDVTCSIAIFMCPFEKAQKILPHPSMKPVKMPRGRALVLFSNYVYRNVLGVPPYNEIAMTIPIMMNPKINVPVLPMITPWFKEFGFYVFSMPVTSLENQIRGEKIWGLPKVVQEIEIDDQESQVVTSAREENGEVYYELNVPKVGTPTHFDVGSNLYSLKDGQFLQSATHFKGTFKVKKHMSLLFRKDVKADRNYLKLGDTPSGKFLKELEMDGYSFPPIIE